MRLWLVLLQHFRSSFETLFFWDLLPPPRGGVWRKWSTGRWSWYQKKMPANGEKCRIWRAAGAPERASGTLCAGLESGVRLGAHEPHIRQNTSEVVTPPNPPIPLPRRGGLAKMVSRGVGFASQTGWSPYAPTILRINKLFSRCVFLPSQ